MVRTEIIIPVSLLLTSCAYVPVFHGEYMRNQVEIKDEILDSRKKISDNAEMMNTLQNVDESAGKLLAREHALDISKWSKEDIRFSEPTAGNTFMNVLMGLVGISGIGGLGAFKKIANLKDTVKTVASMDGDAGVEEAKKRGHI